MRLALSVLLFGPLVAADLSPDQQQRVLEKVRAYSQGYGDRLQDFTCVKVSARSVDSSGSGSHWKDLDTREHELTYVAHHESSRLVKVTGTRAPNSPSMNGEFGGLTHLFDPRARTSVIFDHAEGSTCLVKYRAGLDSGVALHYVKAGKEHWMAHHGTIFADCESGVVSRLQMETDPVKSKDDSLATDITYGPVKIGDREFMLPLTAEDTVRDGKTITRAEVKFTRYKKYAADSAIHFDREN